LEDAEALHKKGLARGASLDNTLVLENGRFLNPPRFPDEPARHKILDLLGDLALLGERLAAHVVCVGGGHALHLRLARAIQRASG
jgi:UDP-3-O-[3-hydroxymyristoyl] N-acetylglucosamine deacetylase